MKPQGGMDMDGHPIVSRDAWLEARRQLLAREKEFTRLRDELSRQRRELPWVRIDQRYVFDGPGGKESLADLFGSKRQLIVFHFMFAPDWEAGCKSCSFWADGFNGILAHLDQRDVALVAVSRAPLAKLRAFAQRLGWTFRWLSSAGSDFNYDFEVSFRPQDRDAGTLVYNYAPSRTSMTDLPGISVFVRDDAGAVFHTYSCFARGLDMMNPAYQYLDLVPRGRDEGGLPYPMAWVRHRDQYGA
jgi:predicted dithiol-disulfide oxidoreductase (DUF899 family)